MVDFVKHALFAVVIGYQLVIYGMLTSSPSNDSIQAMMIIAFLCYTPALILGAGMIVSSLRNSKIIAILNAILLLGAAVFCIAGLGVQGTDNVLLPYSGTFTATAMLLATLAAIMYILTLCCGSDGGSKVNAESADK